MNLVHCQKQPECHQHVLKKYELAHEESELSQEESDLLKAGLYFLIQPDKNLEIQNLHYL